MTKTNWIAVLLAAGTLIPQTTSAEVMRSTYSDTLSCPVTEEGEDAFTRECQGPGDVRAVLQYVDGLFAVLYLPMGGKVPMERSDMLEVRPGARHPYGAKHEWRIREGDSRPCAAIIRAYTSKGDLLVVTDLVDGRRLGRVKTNQQAQTLADKACAEATTKPAVDVVAAPITTPAGDETIAQAAEKGKGAFSRAYVETGISGVIDEIELCYKAFEQQASIGRLAHCAAMDITAANVDRVMTRTASSLVQIFFSGDKPDQRIAAGVARLGLDGGQHQAFDEEISAALGVKLTTSEPVPVARTEPKSVFEFPE